MGSSAPASSRPRDTALRQLLRPLEPFLSREEVTEIAVNRPGELWIRSGAGWTRQDLPELTAEYLEALTVGMAVYGGLAVKSLASVVLPGGERGQIVRAPACVDGMAPLAIRKHLAAVRSLADLEREATFERVRDVSFHRPTPAEAMRESERCDGGRLEPVDLELLKLKRDGRYATFLQRAVQTRRNVVIAGKTGSGKTTLARSLIAEVPVAERVVTIEDVHELALPDHPNRVHLMFGEGPGRVSAQACLAACMRLSPDRIFLAELRGGEAWEYVQSLNTGHPGSVTTMHANGAAQAFERIAALVKSSEVGRGLEVGEIRRVLHATLDVVVFVADRKVREVFYDPVFSRANVA